MNHNSHHYFSKVAAAGVCLSMTLFSMSSCGLIEMRDSYEETTKGEADTALMLAPAERVNEVEVRTDIVPEPEIEEEIPKTVLTFAAAGDVRMLVEYACRLRDEGLDAAGIVAGLESIRDRIELYACVNTLEYLHKGGRISHAVYTLGSLAQIKPIISVDVEGKVALPGKAMGMRKGMDMLCKRLTARMPDNEHPVYVMYTNDRSVAETLAARMESQGLGAVPAERIIQVGAAIGAHIGPGACGIVYVGE